MRLDPNYKPSAEAIEKLAWHYKEHTPKLKARWLVERAFMQAFDELAARDARIAELENQLFSRHAEVAQLQDCVGELELDCADRDKRIAELEARIAEQNAILHSVRDCSKPKSKVHWILCRCNWETGLCYSPQEAAEKHLAHVRTKGIK